MNRRIAFAVVGAAVVAASALAVALALVLDRSSEPAEPGEVQLIDDRSPVGSMPAKEALERAGAAVGFTVRTPTGPLDERLTLRSVRTRVLPRLPGASGPGQGSVTLYYELGPADAAGEPATIEVEQFANAPGMSPADAGQAGQWESEGPLAIGAMMAVMYTHLVNVKVTVIAVRGPGDRDGFTVTAPAAVRDEAMALVRAFAAEYEKAR